MKTANALAARAKNGSGKGATADRAKLHARLLALADYVTRLDQLLEDSKGLQLKEATWEDLAEVWSDVYALLNETAVAYARACRT
jgi:hypothetical protein